MLALSTAAMLPAHSQNQQTIPQQQQPEQQPTETSQEQDMDPNYSYSYSIQDSWSGDIKSQHESRQGDSVRGQYRMLESDGTERIVDYSADDRDGFKAVVRHQPNAAVTVRSVPVNYASIHQFPLIPADFATSNSHMIQYHETPLIIANQIRHN